MSTHDMPSVPAAPCCQFYGADHFAEFGCECQPVERALRAWNSGSFAQPMTPEQRDWCLDEIGRVEGYERCQHEADTDQRLAGNVMNAWTDFARDKGLL